MTVTATTNTRSWIFYAALLILFWGVWGAFSALPATKYGYPDEMIYCIWALTMIIPAVFALRGQRFDRRRQATIVAPTTNALAPALTIVVSLIAYQTLPTPYGATGIVLALVGSTLVVYADERRGESPAPAVLEMAPAARNRA